MTCFDAHNHLQHEWLAPHLPRVIDILEEMGLAGAVVNGTTAGDWDSVTRLACEYKWIIPSYGLHPWYIQQRPRDWENLLRAKLDKGGAVGEIGLDRWKEGYDIDDQQAVFRAQLRLAAERNVPATIHCLRAWGALWDIIRSEPVPARGFLLHAYGGPAEMIADFASRGAYFSFNGFFLAETKQTRRDTFRHVPLERLMVETDAPAMPLPPDLTRHPLPLTARGEPVNHPGNLTVAYEGLAGILGMDLESLSATVAENFRRLFVTP
jgi:TatD DNase family protein